jgi:hypothetical protein
MTEYVDMRVSNDWAVQEFGDGLGEPLYGGSKWNWERLSEKSRELLRPQARKIVMRTDYPLFKEVTSRIVEADKKRTVLWGVVVSRKYAAEELMRSALLQIKIRSTFEPCGIDAGTVYDDGNTCPRCGWGRVQRSALRLDLSKVPKNVDIAKTISWSEWVVSQRLADLLRAKSTRGFSLAPVEHTGTRSPRGNWHQLIVHASAGSTCPPTRIGNDYIRDSVNEMYTCPEHDLHGLNVLSEIFLPQSPKAEADVMVTDDRAGIWGGVLVPTPLLIVRNNVFALLYEHKIKGFVAEVVHVVN